MLFSSIPFLFYFLPPVLLLYFLTPDRWKNLTLLLSSLVFYGWGEPRFLLFMLASIAQGYAFGRLMERYPRHKRLFLALSAVLSLGLLGYCKYAGFFLRTLGALTGLSLPALQIALPIGISFYTFQVLSYVIDVYRGTVPPQRNLLQLATYVAMFPQLIAGPIVRYADIAPELTRRSRLGGGIQYKDLHFPAPPSMVMERLSSPRRSKVMVMVPSGRAPSIFSLHSSARTPPRSR